MKYRIRKTKEIVDVVSYAACTHIRFPETDYICYIDSNGKEIIGQGLNLIWDFEPIDEEYCFNWQSFRAEATKDILCHLLGRYAGDSDNKGFVEQAIGITDELIKQLKEKEEK